MGGIKGEYNCNIAFPNFIHVSTYLLGTNMTIYKCDNHKLDIACIGCIKSLMERHNKMLEFIREISNLEGDPATTFRYYLTQQAQELLKEIGKQ